MRISTHTKPYLFLLLLPFSLIHLKSADLLPARTVYDAAKDTLRLPGEYHLRNIKQLTFGNNNAEAYWSFDDKQLIFQSAWKEINPQPCDQIFKLNIDGSNLENGKRYMLLSTGKGRTTCSYFLKDGRIIYASTHAAGDACPDYEKFPDGRYVWPIFKSYDIYIANADGSDPKLLIGGEGYDAEATVSPDGKYIVFTSTRSGDLELWRYEIGTGKLLQITNELGYDGGAFFSRDSKYLVWRASRPVGTEAEIYKKLLLKGLIEPKDLNIYMADIDGKNVHQVTHLPGANWAPFFHPDGKRILFCSNYESLNSGGRTFEIYMINTDGTGLEKITNSETFDSFAMFSYDGRKLAFCSNRRRDGKKTHDTNVYVADWIDMPGEADRYFSGAK
jgi:Tol biopolymer transport system component